MNFKLNLWNLSTWGPALCISTALMLVLLLGGWGAFQDWRSVRQTVLRNEIVRVRSHAERTAGNLERKMAEAEPPLSLAEVAQSEWLRQHWARFIPPPDLIYCAVVDEKGIILSHSDPQRERSRLCSDWNAWPVPDAGPAVYATSCGVLTDGPPALDIVVPVQLGGNLVGAYHTGVNEHWMEQQIEIARRRSAIGWGCVIGGIIAVVLLSSLSLYQITRRSFFLEGALQQSRTHHLTELNQLMSGLAHELRNPLNTLRLNLFTAERAFRGLIKVDTEEVITMLGESVREIERVDGLVTVLLGYARADAFELAVVDVSREILGVVQFLGPALQSSGIEFQVDVPTHTCFRTRTGRGQVRQVLLNLLNNARNSVPAKNGRIQIALERRGCVIKLRVSDNGTGIRPEHRERLFSPFFTTKEQGTGLGLAIVRSLMERSGGQAECRSLDPGDCQFEVTWPAYHDVDPLSKTL